MNPEPSLVGGFCSALLKGLLLSQKEGVDLLCFAERRKWLNRQVGSRCRPASFSSPGAGEGQAWHRCCSSADVLWLLFVRKACCSTLSRYPCSHGASVHDAVVICSSSNLSPGTE